MSNGPRKCRGCGKPVGARAYWCGICLPRARAQRDGMPAYVRTHVHEWADGHKTIELGVNCDGTDHH